MIKLLILPIIAILFFGCGDKIYYNSTGKTAMDFETDKIMCINYANGVHGTQMPYSTERTAVDKQYRFQGRTNDGRYFSGTATQKATPQQQANDFGNAFGNFMYNLNKEKAIGACLNNFGWYEDN